MFNKHSITGFGLGLSTLAIAAGLLLVSASTGCAERIKISAEKAAIPSGPVACTLKAPAAATIYKLDKDVWGQVDSSNRLWFWTKEIPAGKTVEYKASPASEKDAAGHIVKVEQTGLDAITVTIDGDLFTILNFKKSEPRVYLYPLMGPTGAGVTRDYIMRDNPIEAQNKKQDHPHHRSMWVAYGDVRIKDFDKPGYDFWAEPKDKPLPKQVLTKVVRTASGPVFGQIEAIIEWQTPEGQRVFSETRTYTFFRADKNERVIDTKSVFKFSDMDVKFGQTKEGGMIALRLAVTMDENGVKTPKEQHGKMVNSRGGVGMEQCWNKPAEWCDYVGPLEGEPVGIAVFDAPKNFRHPTTWHIRNYGLYTANPFMPAEKDKDYSKTWKKGESTEFNYRVVIHKGDTGAAQIPSQWKLYSSPPKINLE